MTTTTLRKFWWARASIAPALVLTGLTVGCNTEEPASTTPASSSLPSIPAPKKGMDSEPPKKDEMAPAPAPAPSTPNKPDAKDDAPVLTPPKLEEPGKSGDSPKSAAAAIKLSDQEIAAIKTLPPEDQAIALKQKVCPVSGAHLGDENMGAPFKITAEGTTFFLCCKGCVDDVKADPKAVIAKLGK